MSAATSARPVASAPCTRLSTPGGRPASTASSAISPVDHGVSSAGFITTVLPHTSAPDAIPTASANGKLNGQMTANTPYGRMIETLSSFSDSRPSGIR